MIIVDCETSGVDPRRHGLLSLGAIDYLTGETFYQECRLESRKGWTKIALEINGFSSDEIYSELKQRDVDLLQKFCLWAAKFRESNILAGHNVGHLDLPFLEEIAERIPDYKLPFSHRTVDLHTLAYQKFGKSLKSDEIYSLLGMAPEPRPHNALTGAMMEAEAFWKFLS